MPFFLFGFYLSYHRASLKETTKKGNAVQSKNMNPTICFSVNCQKPQISFLLYVLFGLKSKKWEGTMQCDAQ
jgi:hypothetical protein